MSSEMFPRYSTYLFCDIWDNDEDFVADYKASALYDAYTDTSHVLHLENSISDTASTQLFWLLYARYGNSPIANRDPNQFKYKVFSLIYQYGPKWEKELDIQKKVRALDDETIRLGSKAIYNQALNPATEPSTATLDELTYINAQNTTNYKKSPLEGYALLEELLKDDITKIFIDKFNICFKKFVSSERPLIYVTEDEDDGN